MPELSLNALKARRGCEACRTLHLKCDFARPKCTKCQTSGGECVRDLDIRFKHTAGQGSNKAEYHFDDDQRWVDTRGDLRYLDETREIVSFYDHEFPSGHAFNNTPWSRASGETTDNNAEDIRPRDGHHADGSGSMSLPVHRDLIDSRPVSSPITQAHPLPHQTLLSALSSPSTTRNSFVASPSNHWHVSSPDQSHRDESSADTPGRLYLRTPIWPLNSPEEAKLLRHFVEHLARAFDLTDPERHFRIVVPQRAGTCPTLLNAIFALSARHLSRIGDYDPLVSDRYHQECLKHLIPMLDDSTAVLDENLLASTIILRHLEEIEVPLSGQSGHSHLLGAHIFLEAQVRTKLAGGLREAAFWVGLRQAIFFAFINQRGALIPAIERCDLEVLYESAPDHVWSCRMVMLCADVIRHCFSDTDQSTRTYMELITATNTWNDNKPLSFAPIYREPADDRNIFPVLWYLREEISLGIQHYFIARILLTAFNPRIAKIGTGRALALREMDEEIKDHIRTLCGICQSNRAIAPNYTYAAMAIIIAGDKFTEPEEQHELLQLLETCDKAHAHPTARAQEDLKAAWGWT